jgi:hypothetical protein
LRGSAAKTWLLALWLCEDLMDAGLSFLVLFPFGFAMYFCYHEDLIVSSENQKPKAGTVFGYMTFIVNSMTLFCIFCLLI